MTIIVPSGTGNVYAGSGTIQHPSWSPYDENGGTCVAVSGNDYCVVASSNRLSTGFSILTRDESKIIKMSHKCVIATANCQADRKTLQKTLQTRHIMYMHNHGKPMSVAAMAQLVSNTLYYKRFFPYYTYNLVCGLDEEGKGAVYTYDPVGSYERTGYSCEGTGKDLIQPVLDNQLKASSPLVLPAENWMTALPMDDAVDLVKDAFVSAGERDIYTGDVVELLIITKDGVRTEHLDLKKD
ncbi:hypothetical protein WJX73_009397 [Symbiochloris irregularis]|uniref:Proteasome subunit beta n=1 Tax=Symbiochloris irregularis TaxID=706552 RepID=A0AAW1PN28_9CHLO